MQNTCYCLSYPPSHAKHLLLQVTCCSSAGPSCRTPALASHAPHLMQHIRSCKSPVAHAQGPKTLAYNPAENALLITSDLDGGSFELYIVPKETARGDSAPVSVICEFCACVEEGM
eukprot:1105596-Pelagomonas_calceolata.AAC.5